MNYFNLNEINVFIKVVQAGSFTKAAKILDMPVSTVSARVASLEQRLGVTLLQRTTRQLKLTQAGDTYYEKCLQGLNEIIAAEDLVTSNQQAPHGLLRITAPVYLGSVLLPEIILEMNKKYPEVNIELILSDQSVDLIAEGIDLAIRAGQLKDSSLISKKIGDTYFIPFAGPNYLRTHGTPKHPKDLIHHRCLQFLPLGRNEWRFYNGKSSLKVRMNENLVFDELNITTTLAQAGLGIALLPCFVCNLKPRKENLVQILPEWKSSPRPLYFVYPPQKFLAPKVKVFLELAYDAIKNKL